MKKNFKLFLCLIFTNLLFFTNCSKKETLSVDNETQSVVDNSIADQEYMAIAPAANQHAINTKGTGASKSWAAPCDTLTYISGDTSDFIPNVVYAMNASSSNCPARLPDGKIRTGELRIRMTGKLKNTGSQMIIKMINYKASGISYLCDSMVITTTNSNALFTTFNIKVINGVCQTANWVVKYTCDKTITNYAFGNPKGSDPFTSIFGTSTGINRQGRSFKVSISSATPLIKHRNCEYIDKGILELTPEGYQTRSVDFGNGTCDVDANYTVNGNTIAFKLK
jgi:hypothetical protein